MARAACLACLLALVLAGACTRTPDTARSSEHDQARFVGTWRRTDADYVLRVTAATGSNGMRVEYLNPRSIHVSRSEVRQAAEGPELTVVLNDTGYPGSTYTLRHNTTQDTLEGVYFHAGLGRPFDIAFVRDIGP
ncbi:MAG: hypothetical protein ACOY3Y_15465 [Acidobacteriota bacterium]